MRKRLQVTDDSGFLALVDPDADEGYVGREWQLDDLFARVRDQMAARRLLIWGTGSEGHWTVGVSVGHDGPSGVREVTGSIDASKGRLLLTNYESLTMAAQYQDVILPQDHEADLVIAVRAGPYQCRIVQHALTDHSHTDAILPDFTIALRSTDVMLPPWASIPWSEGES